MSAKTHIEPIFLLNLQLNTLCYISLNWCLRTQHMKLLVVQLKYNKKDVGGLSLEVFFFFKSLKVSGF